MAKDVGNAHIYPIRIYIYIHAHTDTCTRRFPSRKYFNRDTIRRIHGVTRRFMQNIERQNRASPEEEGGEHPSSVKVLSSLEEKRRRRDGPATSHPFSLSGRARNFLLFAVAVAYEPGRQPR